MRGKTVIVTGANSGIGKETATTLARKGAKVVMLCRNAERGEVALADVQRDSSSDDVELILGDLSEPDSVREFVSRFQDAHHRLDVLVNNAGVYLSSRRTNSRGWEMTWAINHFGPFLLTTLLLDNLKRGEAPRVVTVSSLSHRFGVIDLDDPFYDRRVFVPLRVYSDTKLANILTTRELARRAADDGISAYSLHPGMIATNLSHDDGGLFSMGAKLSRPFLRSAEQGAKTSIWLASADEIPGKSGYYYASCKPRCPAPQARDDETARKLWDYTCDQLQ